MYMSRLFIHKIFIGKRNLKALILKMNTLFHPTHVQINNIVYPIAEKPNNIQPNDFKSKVRLNKIEKREYKVSNDPISKIIVKKQMHLPLIRYLEQ
jgi:hypothetical protein